MQIPVNSHTLKAFFKIFETFNKNAYLEPTGDHYAMRAEFSEDLCVHFYEPHYKISLSLNSRDSVNQDLVYLGIKEGDLKDIHEQISPLFSAMTPDEWTYFINNSFFIKNNTTYTLAQYELRGDGTRLITKFLADGSIPLSAKEFTGRN